MKSQVTKVARLVRCDQSGSCVVFADLLCQHQPHGFKVVEGQVRFRGSVPFDHVWIEDEGGAKHDPTLLQFGFFDLSTAAYFPDRAYAPAEFAQVVRRHPQRGQFNSLLK